MQTFDRDAFLTAARAACDISTAGYGLVFERWQRDVNSRAEGEIDRLPADHQDAARQALIDEGILIPDVDEDDEEDDGYCRHDFPPNCCPIGCDDLD